MIDLMTATQDAFYAALAPMASPEFGQVVQHVPENAQPPLTVVGRIEAGPFDDSKGGGLEQLTVEVIHTYRGEQRRRLFAMMQAGRTAVADATLSADGVSLSTPAWVSSEADIGEDGVTYQGVVTWQVLVQPA